MYQSGGMLVESVEKVASGLLAFSGFTSIYLGGPFVLLFLAAVVGFTGVKVAKNRQSVQ